MTNFLETLKGWSLRRKVTLAALIVITLAAMILLFAWSKEPDYSLLFSNLSETDSGSILEKLQEMNVDYKIDAKGIHVPSASVYDLRLQMAAQGLPQGGGVGFEIFDKKDFGTTSFVQKLNYKRAMQGELARTISALAEVNRCRVHLSIPEKTLFAREEAEPSASVLIKLKTGRFLSKAQVYGIVHLISRSVEGLTPKNVTIVDDTGKMLTKPIDDMVTLSSNQLEYQARYEKSMESRVIDILEPIIGRDKVKATVAAEIDFSRSEQTEESYDPDGQVVRSEQKITEKSITNAKAGVPGVVSNIPGQQTTNAQAPQSQSQKENDAINYEISKITKRIVGAYGEVQRLSIAVIVDGTYSVKKDSKEVVYAPRTDKELKSYEDLVKKAIGYATGRGDEVSVVNMPFKVVDEEAFKKPPVDYIKEGLRAAKYLTPLLAALLFLLLVVRPLLKTIAAPKPPALPLPQTVAEIERAIKPGEIPPPKEKTKEELVAEWAKARPEEALNFIKELIGAE